MGKTRLSFFLILSFFLAASSSGPCAWANSLLISPNPNPGQSFPLQGDCQIVGINPANPGIDRSRATWACPGASGQMLHIFYREGPEECVYIDNNADNGGQIPAFFVPLQTSDEWAAFRTNLPGGVRLRYGCMGLIVSDPCGNRVALPDAPASDNPRDVVHITTAGNYEASYQCPLTEDNGQRLDNGCGAWQKIDEQGDCATTSILPIGPPTPPTRL